MNNNLYVVGIGPGDVTMLSGQARSVLEACDVIAGYTVYADLIRPAFPDKEYLTTGMTREKERCEAALREASKGRNVCIICSGDAGVYGMAGLTLEMAQQYPDVTVHVIPGITAALAGGALLGAPLGHDFAVISLSDRLTEWAFIEQRLRLSARAGLCMAIYNPASRNRPDYLAKACRILLEELPPETVCGMASNIGRDQEHMQVLTLGKLVTADADMFTTVFIGNGTTREIAGRMVTPRGYRIDKNSISKDQDTVNQDAVKQDTVKQDTVNQNTEDCVQKESRILVFGGTTEGRELSDWLKLKGIPQVVCVATEYGEEVLRTDPEPPEGRMKKESVVRKGEELCTVLKGRMTEDEMVQLLQKIRFMAVADATHPYALEVSANIRSACARTGVLYLRLLRTGTEEGLIPDNAVYADSTAEAAGYLKDRPGKIFLTTGSKELETFMKSGISAERVTARVLPSPEVLELCRSLGLSGRQIIAMQGPFSAEMNQTMLREYGSAYLVTKDSGKTGGFPEKMEACRQLGVVPVIIRRPDETEGMNAEELKKRILQLCGRSAERDQEQICGRYAEPDQELICSSLPEQQQELICAGIGMGDAGTLTVEAVRCIMGAEVLFGAARMLHAVREAMKELQCSCRARMVEEYRSEKMAEYLSAHPASGPAVLLVSGDVGFYSAAASMQKAFPGKKIRFVCGISSVAFMASRLGMPWQDILFLSLHGKKAAWLPAVRRNEKVMLIAGNSRDAGEICEDLAKAGLEHVRVTLGLDLGSPSERIIRGLAGAFGDIPEKGLPVVLLENEQAGEPQALDIADDCFIRGSVPMTKQEIRTLVLAKLHLKKDSVLYDIGAGTGSVSVAAAALCPEGKVFAVEKNHEAIELIRENARKFGADVVHVVEGTAPQALEDLPVPTHAFIGGTGGDLEEILKKLYDRNPDIRIVVTAVTLESISALTRLIQDGTLRKAEAVQINVSRAKELGRYHLFQSENPVMIVTAPGKNEETIG